MGEADTDRPPKGEPVWVVAVRLRPMQWSRGEGRTPHPTPRHGVGRLCPHTGPLLSHTSSFLLTSFLTVLPPGGAEVAPHHGRCKRRTRPPDGTSQTCLLCGTRAQGAVTLPRTPHPA